MTGAEQVTERYRGVHFTDGDAAHAYVWIACDTVTTRTLTSYVLKDLAVPKHRVKGLGYWRA